MSQLRIRGVSRPLRGSVPLPDDEDIAASRAALAVLSRGTTRIELGSEAPPLLWVLTRAFQLLGVTARIVSGPGRSCVLEVEGVGVDPALSVAGVLDVRGSSRAAALLMGIVAGRRGGSELLVDPIVVELLGGYFVEARGARISQREDGAQVAFPARPGPERPGGGRLETAGLFPWVKQAFLLQALGARTASECDELVASADHLERALLRNKAPISVLGTSIEVHPPRDNDALPPSSYQPIGSCAAGAALCSAALMVPGSQIVVRDCSLNPTRADWLQLMRILGADVGVSPRGDRQGEPVGEISVSGGLTARAPGSLRVLSGENVARAGDTILPLLAPLGRLAQKTVLSDLVSTQRGGDARVFARAVGLLRAAGIDATVAGPSVVVTGLGPDQTLRPLEVTTGGDGRLAQLGTLLALAADGTSVIDDVDCLRDQFPRWVGTLRALGAEIEVRDAP